MDFLQLKNKHFFITGVANKKSVAYFVAKNLIDGEAQCSFSVQSETQKETVLKLFPNSNIYLCNVESEEDLANLKIALSMTKPLFDGFLHSIAFANFSEGPKPFHETLKKDFLQATDITCFSFVSISNVLKEFLTPSASCVTISISNTKAVAYGYLGPIKAALDVTVSYLAKSFSEFSGVRFNAVCSGPLKTSASSGIPNYIDNYLYAEKLTLRKKALETSEVANAATFLLSPASSGINASNMLIDAGMNSNYFDQAIVKTVMKNT